MPGSAIVRRVRPILLIVLLSIVALELAARAAWRALALDGRTAGVEVESPPDGPLFTFDPVSGYRISPTPVRYAKFDGDGLVQSHGVMKGNNLGFHDADEFTPIPASRRGRRIAVFGDSMSAGVFLPVNWPRRIELLSEERGRPLDILNFSIDGGGVMNWWSILTRLVEPEGYELDGCVFAVCCDDLARGFFIRHEDFGPAGRQLWFGRVRGFRPENLPDSLESARSHFFWLGDAAGCTTKRMDDFLARRDVRGGPRSSGSALVDLAVLGLLLRHFQPQGGAEGAEVFSVELKTRILEMRDSLRRLGVPRLVVQVPLLRPDASPPEIVAGIARETRTFAELLDAPVVAGGDAFRGISPDRLQECFLKGDAHWNQTGSDQFAQHLEVVIAEWLEGPATR